MAGVSTGAAVQNINGDSRIVIAGGLDDPCSNDKTVWAVVRYLRDGSLDTSFGVEGVVTTSFSDSAYAVDLAVDPGGRIVVVGYAPPKRGADRVATVVRYSRDGSLDTSFGTGGVVMLPYGRSTPYTTLSSVGFQSDGKIILVGAASPGSLAVFLQVFRLNANGTLDRTFNGTGQYLYTATPASGGYAVATQQVGSEERVVVAGRVAATAIDRQWHGALWRFTASGMLDPGFGAGGVAVGDPDQYSAVAVDGSRLVVVGAVLYYPSEPHEQLTAARFTETGAPDPSFGDGGKLILPSPTATSAHAVAIDLDGHILVAGWKWSDTTSQARIDTAAWRFTDSGVLDSTFGIGGSTFDPITADSKMAVTYRLLQQPDGTFVTAGVVKVGEKYIPYAFLARFWQ